MMAGEKDYPMRADPGSKNGVAHSWLLGLCLLATIGIAAAGYFHFEARKQHITLDKQNDLSAIAQLKVNEISMWLKERIADAGSIQGNPWTVGNIRRGLTDPGEQEASRAEILAWMESLRVNYSYQSVLLLDGSGALRLAVPDDARMGPSLLSKIPEAARTPEPMIMDFHQTEAVQGIHLDIIVPLRDPGGAPAVPVAFVVLRIDPHTFLYPLIQLWPTPSPSAETLMVRKEGEEVLYLNELRHRHGTALSLRSPASREQLPAAMAVRGVRGVVEGIDYRGVPVLAAIVGVPDTSWIVIAKVDTEEIYEPIRQRARTVTLVVCVLILVSGVIAASIWRQQRAALYRKQYETELARLKLAERYEYLSKHANDIILLIDEKGRVVDANESAVSAYGYTLEELLALGVQDLRAMETVLDIDSQMQEIRLREGLVFETLHKRRDGSTFPVEVSSRTLSLGDQTFYQSIIRDISERKQAEERIVRSNRLYAVLSQVNQAIVRVRDRDELFREICRIVVIFGKFRMAWIGLADHEGGVIHPVAQEGIGKNTALDLTIPLGDVPRGRGPTGRAVRESGYTFCNDVEGDPQMASWRAALTELGVRSCASIPIRVNTQVVGTLSVYAAERNFFDEEERKLLEEIGMDISFGLEKIEDEIRREASEAAVRASEERFRAIFREAAISIFLMEPGGRLLATNRAMQACFGYTEDELLLMHYGQFVHPDDVGSCMAQFQGLFREAIDATSPETRRYVRKNGDFLWGRLVASAIRNALGDVQLVVGMIEDITAQKEAQDSILRARDFYLTLFDESPNLIWRAGPDARCDFFNATWLSFTGRDRERELGYGWTEGLHPADRDAVLAAYLEAFHARRPFEMECRLRRHDGEYRLLVVVGRPFKDFDGSFAGYVGSGYDLTDRKRAEERLAESERKFRNMLENVQLVGLTLNPDGTVGFCNDYLLALTGWTRDEVLGRSWFDRFVPKEEREARERAFLKRMAMRMKPRHHESDILTRTGQRRTISWNATDFTDAEGVILSSTSLGEDVTDRKRYEIQLRQAQKMEAIGTLAGGIAHDFNNILAAILGYTEIALYSAGEGDPVKGYLRQVLKASSRAKELIGQILAFSRRSEQEKRPIQLSVVIGEALKLLRASLPSTIEIRQDFAAAASFILADPTQMHQVVMNLCTNAAHAMEGKGGQIEVSLRDVAVDAILAASDPDLKPMIYVRLSVSDTGCGMDRSTRDRIFDPFFTTKPTGAGTGMGLAVVHGIVKSHGGSITVHSELGRGSVFHVFFPKLESGPALEPERQGRLTPGEGCVLFVDDEEVLVQLGGKILRMLGYEVVAKTSSEEALEAFRGQPERFDLVVTDYTMPRMTGIDLTEKLREIRSDIPVILCTGYSEKLSEEDVKKSGVRALLLKPLSVAQLAETVAAALKPCDTG